MKTVMTNAITTSKEAGWKDGTSRVSAQSKREAPRWVVQAYERQPWEPQPFGGKQKRRVVKGRFGGR